MLSPELLTAVQDAIALLESWRGRRVRAEVTLARGTGNAWEYDRHVCTHSQVAFVVQHVGWRFSGSALSILGAVAGHRCGHEVSVDALVAVRRADDGSLALKERFGRAAERVSVLRLVASAPDAEPGAAPDRGPKRPRQVSWVVRRGRPPEGRAVNPSDRKRLEDLRFAAEVIARTEDVLRVWGEPELFARCSYCGKVCFHPDRPRGKHQRKKRPADLFLKRELVGFRDHDSEVICWPCDGFQFQYG